MTQKPTRCFEVNLEGKTCLLTEPIFFSLVVHRLCDRLPSANVTLLRHFLCVLVHIAANSSHNMMSASNLAVCVGPSLLWAPITAPTGSNASASLNPALALSAEATASKQVPALVAVLIDKCTLLFGAETVRFLPTFFGNFFLFKKKEMLSTKCIRNMSHFRSAVVRKMTQQLDRNKGRKKRVELCLNVSFHNR